MRNAAGTPAAGGGSRSDNPEKLRSASSRRDRGRRSSNAVVPSDLHDAWRLAFVVVADADLATGVLSRALVEASRHQRASRASRVELLEATLRISLTRAADNPDCDTDSSVTAALWRLGPEQRAALWLSAVDALDDATLGAVLGLSAPNAGHVAERAARWLDVALGNGSGPLCDRELDLPDYIAGLMFPNEIEELENHLPRCPTCQTRLRASQELSDLRSVLDQAVPEPPAGLTVHAPEEDGRAHPSDGVKGTAPRSRRTPAVRPLGACCAALIVVAVVGVRVVRPANHHANPPGATDPRAINPASSSYPYGGSSPDTLAITTTSVAR